jgi:hypothetical protein
MDKRTSSISPDLEATLRTIETQIAGQAKALSAIRTVLARGTGDHTEAAETATAAVRLTDRVEEVLRSGPRSLEELALDLEAPAGKIAGVLRALRSERRICNLGTEDQPIWFWRVGDKATAQEIQRAAEQALRIRPMTLRELCATLDITNRNRASSALVYMQIRAADGDLKGSVLNVGNERIARWFVAPPPVAGGPKSRGGARTVR